MMQAIAAEHGGSAFEWATRPEDRSRLWKARHAAYYAAHGAASRASRRFATDACVPISRLADCVLETKADVERERPRRADRRPRRRRQLSPGACCSTRTTRASAPRPRRSPTRVSMRAIAMGGTCTGEHGIGIHKLDALVAEHGEAVDLMRTIKRALDPHNIMNPGKTVPDPETRSTCTRSTSATRTTRRGRCAAGSPPSSPARRFAK